MQSRVWYAHNLVVSEERETKMGESAVAAAARQALESTRSIPRSKPRPRWGVWFVGVSLAGAAASALFLPSQQDAAEPQLSITSDPSPPAVASGQDEGPAAADAAVEKLAAGSLDQNVVHPAAEAPVQASPENSPEYSSGGQPRVAGYTAMDTGTLATGSTTRAGDVQASPFASAPAEPSDGVGEIVPENSAPEIEVVEVDEGGSAPLTEEDGDGAKDASGRAASQSRARKKSTTAKQSAEYFDTGDCAMPPWAWRVFGFTEPVKKKPGCGS